nr:sulfurtransferase TusA family protein [Desulfobacula sp.]
MTTTHILDLRGVISPLNLLKCKSCLASIKKGEVLEVLLTDTDVVADLMIIIKKSSDDVVYKKRKADCICLGIKKGKNIKTDEKSTQKEAP